MGLKDAFQEAAQTIITAFDNIPVTATYTSVGSITYSATAGAVSLTTTMSAVTVVFVAYQQTEIDNLNVMPYDKKALIAELDLDALSITPNITDKIIYGGEVWQVIDKKIDPAEALWQLQVRQP
jgi:hypothetical protein